MVTTAVLPAPNSGKTFPRYQGHRMTVEQFSELPEDGVHRELINGVVREYSEEERMTTRNRRHGRSTTNVAACLKDWLRLQPEPRGEVLTGEIGVRLHPEATSQVGIDVAYISPELSRATPEDAVWVVGAPVLAVEIISPSDTVKDVKEKIAAYLAAGVAAVWLLDPYDRTVAIHRRGEAIRVLGAEARLENEPYLPGFAVAVAELFDK